MGTKSLLTGWNIRPILVLAIFAISGIISAQTSLTQIKFEAESGTLVNANIQSDSNASGGSSIAFSQPSQGCGAGQVGTSPQCFSVASALGVDTTVTVNNFDRRMKGMAFGNWTFGWGRPLLNEITPLKDAVRAIDPGIIRYAGGLWANYVGYDGNERNPYTDYTVRGRTYNFTYSPRELRDLDAFAKSINSEAMIQVNISNNDPQMWADLVKFVKDNNLTNITMFELGNELDLERYQGKTTVGITTEEYRTRVSSYQQAMRAINPDIKIVGGVSAGATDVFYDNNWSGVVNDVSPYIRSGLAGARDAGKDLHSVSYHWYQTSDAVGYDQVKQWTFGINSNNPEFWRENYTRAWSGKVTPWIRNTEMSNYPNTEIGVSELGVNSSNNIPANGNHIGALWYSDVLGRLAYTGVDWVTQWDTYTAFGSADTEQFSLMYADNEYSKNPNILMRPTYMAYLMYKQYFGDIMVQSLPNNEENVSIWASRDSTDPTKLKLRITNFSSQAVSTPVAWKGFNASSAQTYVMSSTNPTGNDLASARSTAPTTINGVRINGNDILNDIAQITPNNVSTNTHSLTMNLPAYSSVALVLSGVYQ